MRAFFHRKPRLFFGVYVGGRQIDYAAGTWRVLFGESGPHLDMGRFGIIRWGKVN